MPPPPNARGFAEAAITRAAGLAEAESIKAQAQAMEAYGNAATPIGVIKRLREISVLAGMAGGAAASTVLKDDRPSAS